MGSVYDQEQTQGIKDIKNELKKSSNFNKWILGISIATLAVVLIQTVVMLIKK